MTSDMCKCPRCAADLRDKPIRPENQAVYGYGPDETLCRYGCGGVPHYSKLISIYDRGRDRTVAWQCPACGESWERT